MARIAITTIAIRRRSRERGRLAEAVVVAAADGVVALTTAT